MEYHYKTKGGVCSHAIDLKIEDGIIKSLSFDGGCDGNTHGISKLVIGMKAEDVANRLRGTKCGFKESSCPDQLANAVDEALAQAANSKKP